MLAVVLALVSAAPFQLSRDAYGVPLVRAKSQEAAFYGCGYAVAEDRLWQLEQSWRVARGEMVALNGPSATNADREAKMYGYSEQELRHQLDKLSPSMQLVFRSYADGINGYVRSLPADRLPLPFSQRGIKPHHWTDTDCAAVSIRLLQQFGRGGAGELRNLTVVAYLRSRGMTEGRIADVLDDLAGWEDPRSPVTLANGRFRGFRRPSRAVTLRQLAALPRLALGELLPMIRLASRESSTLLAQASSAPYQTGSYAVAIGASASTSGRAMLLSAPQMGLRMPSIAHEIAMEAPGLRLSGMDVPGVPGVLVGHNQSVAWGLTSGIADTDDIWCVAPRDPRLSVHQGTVGGATFTWSRFQDFPILPGSNPKVAFVRASSTAGRELASLDSLAQVWRSQTSREAVAGIGSATLSFHFLCADRRGSIGYRYVGLVPRRAGLLDPRLPVPAGFAPETLSVFSADQLPSAVDPPGGRILNWNNRPIAGWPNSDTPAFGRIHEANALAEALPGRVSYADLRAVAQRIANQDPAWRWFAPYVAASGSSALAGFDGRMVAGSVSASVFSRFLDELRTSLFVPVIGNLLGRDNLRLAVQPSVLLAALEGRTRIDYRAGRSVHDLVSEALARAAEGAPRFVGSFARFEGEPPLPEYNRGTFTQIVELFPEGVRSVSQLPPGEAESGPHRSDQLPLARTWTYKPTY